MALSCWCFAQETRCSELYYGLHKQEVCVSAVAALFRKLAAKEMPGAGLDAQFLARLVTNGYISFRPDVSPRAARGVGTIVYTKGRDPRGCSRVEPELMEPPYNLQFFSWFHTG